MNNHSNSRSPSTATWHLDFIGSWAELESGLAREGIYGRRQASNLTRGLVLEDGTHLVWWPSTGRVRCSGRLKHVVISAIDRQFAPEIEPVKGPRKPVKWRLNLERKD